MSAEVMERMRAAEHHDDEKDYELPAGEAEPEAGEVVPDEPGVDQPIDVEEVQ